MHEYQQTRSHEKVILYKLPHRPWEVAEGDVFTVKNNTLVSMVGYCSKYGLSEDSLMRAVRTVIA